MGADISISPACGKQLENVVRMFHLQLAEHGLTPSSRELREAVDTVLRNRHLGFILAAWKGASTVGCAFVSFMWSVEHAGRVAWLEEMYVMPGHRGAGVGKALLMREGGYDLLTGEESEASTFFDDKVDIHHIFPEKWCKLAEIEPVAHNSVINKTTLKARTNRQIGGRATSKYLPAIEKAAGIDPARMDEILHSHCIPPEETRGDRFWEFYAARAEELLKRIERATGKSIARKPEVFRPGVVTEKYDEGPQDWDAEESVEDAA